MAQLPRLPRKDYPHVEQLRKDVLAKIGTGKQHVIHFVTKDWRVVEMVPVGVTECFVTFEVPYHPFYTENNRPKYYGHRYPRISYEEVERQLASPQGSVAARAVASSAALALYPEMKNNKKKDAENEAKRDQYVEEHWRAIHADMLKNMQAFDARQRYDLCEKKFRIYPNDSFLYQLKEKMIPKPNHFSEFLEC